MIRAVLFFSFFLITSSLFAQEAIKVTGKVYDADSQNPLSYVHVGIQNSSIGTITNSIGQFELNIPQKYQEDSISVSSVGYKSFACAIPQSSDTLQILLKPHTFLLQAVEVMPKPDSARRIVEEAITQINKNYPRESYLMKGFYRETNVKDTAYARLVESAVSIFDRGYDANIDRMRVKTTALRKSDDRRKLDWRESLSEWLYEKNGLVSILRADRLRLKGKVPPVQGEFLEYEIPGEREDNYRFLSMGFTDGMAFSMDSLSYYDGQEVYCISYQELEKPKDAAIAKGQLIIQKDNFAILEINARLELNKKLGDFSSGEPGTYGIFEMTMVDDKNLFITNIKYRPYQGKYYLSFVETKAKGTNSSFLQGAASDDFYQYNQLLVTEIITDRREYDKIGRKESLLADVDMHNVEAEYDSAFWSNYNVLLLNPLNPEVIEDLQQERALDKQFKENQFD
jgi:hypothetical protein